ncbi:carnitine O-acetyltransferase [Amycolatopsis mediterranei S699]|uniref:Carnitine O-acetyltransferase n=2 Tax=Amycolatopsis mediterranei TaxID=33910 RepID=A0A0H3DEV7_AMYMU|nr:carnitine O-acetyltransferase [Amycolatopsis mediterranei U32]AEK45561.1 carnitine O-acetyltransferase [Amycolatopsis mediterranei S699]AGT87466.1 carnitine O-acetyltransferase [Amycolatopsis mediterranei RB]KDO03843.1 carnitine O-acetyltransferase [Amycolatopsis mediterranei]AFO80338.1 carnitine O-acetyltransferase [Amycolatopsis mediterranei S699]
MSSPEWSTRTFGNEDRLPRVPVPTLEDSGRRFLEWCAPLLTPEELAETEAAVAEFLAGPGPELQARLEEYDRSPGVRSWLDTFWPYRYLGRRDRIALNANFFFLFQDSPLGQVERAAELTASAVDYKLKLDGERVPPVLLRGTPQSMVQHKYLFSATRIPGELLDTARTRFPSPERHIVVFSKGTPFRMDVLAEDGRPCSPAQLADGLRAILKDDHGTDVPAGPLTTKARAEWAASRAALIDAGNAAALETIETALFCLCLDDFTPSDALEAGDRLLYGDNRWYDKAVSLIVFEDGTAGINVEHCELDGTTILGFTDALLSGAREEREPADGVPGYEILEFTLTDALREDARAAREAFKAYADATATATVSFDFGANRAKELGMSPDAFAQMAYQLAHRRAKGLTGATYESIATRQFQNGRTEAMRVVTPEVVRFADVLTSEASADEKREAFRAAAAKHVARAKECQAGDAPEQHLWELQLIAKRHGEATDLPLYSSPGWLKMRDDYLSTSSAPSVNIQYFGFGSTSPQCIGIAYVLLPDRWNIYLSTPKHVSAEMDRFAGELAKAVAELQELLAE